MQGKILAIAKPTLAQIQRHQCSIVVGEVVVPNVVAVVAVDTAVDCTEVDFEQEYGDYSDDAAVVDDVAAVVDETEGLVDVVAAAAVVVVAHSSPKSLHLKFTSKILTVLRAGRKGRELSSPS